MTEHSLAVLRVGYKLSPTEIGGYRRPKNINDGEVA